MKIWDLEEWELEDLSDDFFQKFNNDFKKLFQYLKTESKNLQYIKEMEKTDFYCYNDYPNIYYFRILNEEGAFELNMTAHLVGGYNLILEPSDVGEIIRVAIDLDDIDDIDIQDMNTINKDIMKLYDKIGYQAIIIKKDSNAVQRMKEINKVKEYLNKREK